MCHHTIIACAQPLSRLSVVGQIQTSAKGSAFTCVPQHGAFSVLSLKNITLSAPQGMHQLSVSMIQLDGRIF